MSTRLHLSSKCLWLIFLFPSLIFGQEEFTSNLLQGLEYRCVGPTRGGRVTTVVGDKQRPGTFYFGASGGGVWKTSNYGYSWANVSDGYFSTGSIGAINVFKANSDYVYVGTGSDGIRSNVIIGKGVYKSTNAGGFWKHLGLEKAGQIGAVETHPTDSNIVYVAAIGNPFGPNPERGVYRSKNAGEDWELVLFHSDSVGAVDIEICPTNPKIIYATLWRAERKPWTIISGSSEGGIYRSMDGGDSWEKRDLGLNPIGKIDLAVTSADPTKLYALVEAHQGEGGLYISNDLGESFDLISTKAELIDRPFYYCNIDVNPQNPNSIYVNSTGYWHSVNGGKSWKRVRTPHGDNHDQWTDPNDTLVMIQANDGGANVTRDGMKTWSTQSNQPTSELYQVEVDDQVPYWLYAGQQDNSTVAVPSLAPFSSPMGNTSFMRSVGGCETGPAVPKPGNHNIVYSNCKGRFGVYNKVTGQEKQYYVGATNIYGHNPINLKFRFQRVSPIHISPHNPDVIYHCSQYVHKTQDDGVTWEIISPDLTAHTPETQVRSGSPITQDITGEEYYSTIYSIRESTLTKGEIWVGSNDGPVHVTRDNGKTWNNVTPAGLDPGGRVDCVEPSKHTPGKAYFSVLRYQLGDFKPYVFKTIDYGLHWELISDGTNGIPDDFPVRVIREDNETEGLLYAGTEFGMFVSMNDGKSWIEFQNNLPVTPITDIKVKGNDLVLSTMGRSFWILDELDIVRQLSEGIDEEKPKLFAIENVIKYRNRGTPSTSIPSFPSSGANIYYYLPNADSTLEISIFNKFGAVIKSYKTGKPTKKSNSTRSMATGFYTNNAPSNTLLAQKGLNSLKWNLKHGSIHESKRSGPQVSPDLYYVTMKGDGYEEQAIINILIDPRILKSGVKKEHLISQEELALRVLKLQVDADKLKVELEQKVKELKNVKEKKDRNIKYNKEVVANIESALSELNTAKGRYQIPKLISQISYLNSMINRADQLPGKDAYDRFDELSAWFEKVKGMIVD